MTYDFFDREFITASYVIIPIRHFDKTRFIGGFQLRFLKFFSFFFKSTHTYEALNVYGHGDNCFVNSLKKIIRGCAKRISLER